jgi:hypothetical protein
VLRARAALGLGVGQSCSVDVSVWPGPTRTAARAGVIRGVARQQFKVGSTSPATDRVNGDGLRMYSSVGRLAERYKM